MPFFESFLKIHSFLFDDTKFDVRSQTLFAVLLSSPVNLCFRAMLFKLVVNSGMLGTSVTSRIVNSSVSTFSLLVRCFSFTTFRATVLHEYLSDVLAR